MGDGTPRAHINLVKTILVAVVLSCSGCAFVPQTHVAFNPSTGELTVKSPKDVTLNGLRAGVTNGAAYIEIEEYSSKNNVEVLRAVTDANAETAKKGAELIGTLLDAAK